MERMTGLNKTSWYINYLSVNRPWDKNTYLENAEQVFFLESESEAAQSCPTLWDPVDCICLWDSPGKNAGVGCHALLQGIFPTQGLNPGLLHCRQILYSLTNGGSP